MLLFAFAIDDHGGASIYPAIWRSLLAARAGGIGGVLTTVLGYEGDAACDLLGAPRDEGWRMIAMVAFGGADFGAKVPEPLWPPHGRQAELG